MHSPCHYGRNHISNSYLIANKCANIALHHYPFCYWVFRFECSSALWLQILITKSHSTCHITPLTHCTNSLTHILHNIWGRVMAVHATQNTTSIQFRTTKNNRLWLRISFNVPFFEFTRVHDPIWSKNRPGVFRSGRLPEKSPPKTSAAHHQQPSLASFRVFLLFSSNDVLVLLSFCWYLVLIWWKNQFHCSLWLVCWVI